MARSRKRPTKRVLTFALAALAGSSLFACAGILGLDDFSKGECAGAKCGDSGPLPDVVAADVVDSGADVKIDGAIGTDPVAWPKWPMPNYATPPDSGIVLPHQLSYSSIEAGVPDEAVDQVTNLTWRRKLVLGDFDVVGAQEECKKLPNGPWRLPKRIEVVTLLDYGRTGPPFIDPTAFPGFGGTATVWTSSVVYDIDFPNNPTGYKPVKEAWAVSFETGEVKRAAIESLLRVLCVKGKT